MTYFFKYQQPTNLAFNMLRRGEVYFATPNELNDAHECRPQYILKGSEELWQRLVHHVLSHVVFEHGNLFGGNMKECLQFIAFAPAAGTQLKKRAGNRDLPIEEFEIMFHDVIAPLAEDHFKDHRSDQFLSRCEACIRRKFSNLNDEKKYIASFSRDAVNPTMWGHYAQAEQGFVNVYGTNNELVEVRSPLAIFYDTRPPADKKVDFVIGHFKEVNLKLESVDYAKKPPKVNAFRHLISKFSYSEEEDHSDVPLQLLGDAPSKKEELVGLVKYKGWRYEDEVRLIFSSFEQTLPPDLRAPFLGPANIQGLIFGRNMSLSAKERAIFCSYLRFLRSYDGVINQQKLQQFVFFEIQADRSSFELMVVPVGTLKNSHAGQLPYQPINQVDEKTIQRYKAMAKAMMIGE